MTVQYNELLFPLCGLGIRVCESGAPSDALVGAKEEAVDSVAVHDVTTFVGPSEHIEFPINSSSMRVSDHVPSKFHSLHDFFQRPYLSVDMEWSAAFTRNQSLYILPAPGGFLTAPILEKLAGFAYFKCDFNMKIVINAQPFQQGRLLIRWSPFLNGLHAENGLRGSEVTLTGKSGFHCWELDLADGDEITCHVPYVSPMNSIPVYNYEQFPIGSFVIDVLAPLRGADSCSLSVFTYLTNVDLLVPTSLRPAEAGIVGEILSSSISAATDKTVSMVKAAGSSANTLGQNIVPSIPRLLSPVKGIMSMAGNLMSSLGFSKPLVNDKIQLVGHGRGQYMNNVDGLDTSRNLGFNANTSTSVGPIFGTNVDEMAFSYIFQRPNYVNTFTFTTTHAPGNSLLLVPCIPTITCDTTGFDVNMSSSNCKQFTQLGYICNMFNYWRGTLVFTFKFVKTTYHSGRVRFVLAPGPAATPAPIPDMHANEIFDLQSGNMVQIRVPFIWNYGWASLASIPMQLQCLVLNKLRKPNDIVADTVDILMYLHAESDFEVARPIEGRYVAIVVALPTPEVRTLEAGPVSMIDPDIMPAGSANLVNDQTFGEKIVSVNQLCKRFQLLKYLYSDKKKITVVNDRVGVAHVVPYQYSGTPVWYDRFAPLFAYFKGGFRNKFVDSSTSIAPTLVYLDDALPDDDPYSPKVNPEPRSKNYFVEHNAPHFVSPLFVEGMVEVEIPYYSPFHFIPSRYVHVGTPNLTFPSNQLTVFGIDEVDGSYNTFFAVADDFQFGSLIGAPVVAPINFSP